MVTWSFAPLSVEEFIKASRQRDCSPVLFLSFFLHASFPSPVQLTQDRFLFLLAFLLSFPLFQTITPSPYLELVLIPLHSRSIMFSKIWTLAALVLVLALQVTAHAAISPALGVSGTPVRNDVKRPNANSPCGAGVNVANTIDKSTAVVANAAGSFQASAISFNGCVYCFCMTRMENDRRGHSYVLNCSPRFTGAAMVPEE